MKAFFTIFAILFTQILFGQVCIPDPSQIPPNSFIFPTPYQDTAAGSGIQNKACINTPYNQVFQVVIPEEVIFSGFTVHVEKITLNSIEGLPAGLSYECNPTGCTMLKNTTGCMLISGTPTVANEVKIYPIKLNFSFTTQELGTINLSFPDATIAPGKYEIEVLAEGSSACLASNNPGLKLEHKAFVGAGGDHLIMQLESKESIEGNIEIYSANGYKIQDHVVSIHNGKNEFEFNINNLRAGAYFYKIKTGHRFESGKIFIPGN
jgi:hypothetical protein